MNNVQNNKPVVVGVSTAIGAGAGYGIGRYLEKTAKTDLPAEDTFVKNMAEEFKAAHSKRYAQGNMILEVLDHVPDTSLSFSEIIDAELCKSDVTKLAAEKEGMARLYLRSCLETFSEFFGLETTKTKALDQVADEFIGNQKAFDRAGELINDIHQELRLKPDFEAGAKEYYSYLKDQIKNVKKTAPAAYALIGACITGAAALGWALLSRNRKQA